MNPSLKPLVQRRLLEHGTVAPIQEFIQSPLTRGYRNKCEFSVGYSSKRSKAENGSDQNIPDVEKDEVEKSDKMETDTALQTISVGFRLATYKQGTYYFVAQINIFNFYVIFLLLSCQKQQQLITTFTQFTGRNYIYKQWMGNLKHIIYNLMSCILMHYASLSDIPFIS